MTFKIYFQRWPSSLMRQTCWWWMTTNSIPAARSAVFRARQRRNRCLARWKGSEKPDAETALSRGRHFPTSFGRNGHAWALAKHISSLFAVPHDFRRNVAREARFLRGNHPPRCCSHWYFRRTTPRRCRDVSHAEPKFPSANAARLETRSNIGIRGQNVS